MTHAAVETVENSAALPFRLGTRAEFTRLREYLTRVGYTAHDIRRRLEAVPDAGVTAIEQAQALAVNLTDAVSVLLRLFIASEPVDWSDVRRLLTDEGVAALEPFGLLTTEGAAGERCKATVLLYPIGSVYIMSDRSDQLQGAAGRLPDFVFAALTKNTQRFLATLPRTPCEHLLELCAGTGIAALDGSRAAEHAWAVDITGRATRFAEFNAALNGIDNVTILEGDLYEPVRGRTFDRIVAHPPYIPSISREARAEDAQASYGVEHFVFRDGGEDGEQVTRRILAGLSGFLRPGGRLYCTCMLTDRAGAPVERRVRDMLGPTQSEFDVFLAEITPPHRPAEYCYRGALDPEDRFADWMQLKAQLEHLGVERMVYCALVVQRRSAARPVFTSRRQMGPSTASAEVEWAMESELAALDPTLPQRLLDARPVASPRTELAVIYRARDGGFAPAECAVRAAHPFLLDASGPAWVASLISRCDGTRTVREYMRLLVQHGTLPADTSEEAFAGFVQSFVGAGVLHVDGIAAAPGILTPEPPPSRTDSPTR